MNQNVKWTDTDDASTIEITNPVSFKEVNVTYSAKLAKTKLIVK